MVKVEYSVTLKETKKLSEFDKILKYPSNNATFKSQKLPQHLT